MTLVVLGVGLARGLIVAWDIKFELSHEDYKQMNTTMRMKAIPYEPQNHNAEDGIVFEEVVTVRRIIIASVALLMFTLMALGVSTARGSVAGWNSSFESAVRQSERTGQPIFLLIAKSGCPACAEMESNLSQSNSRRALRNAIKVRVESAYNPNLTARFASAGTPTTVIFAAGNYSSPIYQYTGVMDPGTIRQVGRSLDSMN